MARGRSAAGQPRRPCLACSSSQSARLLEVWPEDLPFFAATALRFLAAGGGVAASRASRSARSRSVLARVARVAASYSAMASLASFRRWASADCFASLFSDLSSIFHSCAVYRRDRSVVAGQPLDLDPRPQTGLSEKMTLDRKNSAQLG